MQEINPYAAPKAEVHDASFIPGRPAWVWVIFIFYMLSAAGTVMSYWALLSGALALPEEQKHYFASLGVIDYALSFLILAANVIAAIQLFRLRKLSVYLFPSAFVLGLVVTAWHAANNGWHTAVGGSGFTGAIFGWGISLAICLYTWRLAQTGVLK